MQTDDFKERFFCILENQSVIKVGFNTFIEMVNFLVVNAFRLNDKDFKALMEKLNQREEK